MHIIIPMSGVGQRFVNAGYTDPKPLIKIEGKPIIEHVCNLFPGEEKFTFICNATHLAETNMRAELNRIKPGCNIIEIPNHKLGPVYAVQFISELIEDDEEVIVNYCDFGTYWNYQDFLDHTRNRNADGAIPSYKGFHPHMLGTTNYAFMRQKEQWMLEIKEKEPFTDDRTQEYASNGTYYFKKGAFVKKYFKQLIDLNINLNGEFYVSLVYNLLVQDGLKVSIYDIQHMLQWGTPTDVEEYLKWSNYFTRAANQEKKLPSHSYTTNLIPLAGRGSRFAQVGYKDPKPLIKVSGKPMIVQAADMLPLSENQVFVLLQEHIANFGIDKVLAETYPDCQIIAINETTEGQAITCDIGVQQINPNHPVLISATDNGILYDQVAYNQLVVDQTVDAIIFTFRHEAASKNNPEMYGWVKTNGNSATGVSVKKPISKNPYEDHAIVGTFYFKKASYFTKGLEQLLKKNVRVNGEYYVDSLMGELIGMGLNVKVFEVSDYIGWGTPDDYETFVYWQSYFHKAPNHPYCLEKDITVNKDKITELNTRYDSFKQTYL